MASPATEVLPASQVAELIQGLVKAMRAFQMYLPNNPIHQRAGDNLRAGFAPIFEVLDELVLQVRETELVWEEQVVYEQLQKNESFAWLLYKDGLRLLTLSRGVESDEIHRFLDVVNRARFLPPEASDDLLTLLWEQDFHRIHYQFSEPFAELAPPEAPPPAANTPEAAAQRHEAVQEEAPPRPAGVVDLDDFDSTLYFLDEAEIGYVAREVEHEYRRDIRGASLSILFDIFEQQRDEPVREEIVTVLEQLFPHLLNAGEYSAVSGLLREARKLRDLPDIDASFGKRLDTFEARMSEPAIVHQLMQALEEGAALAADDDIGELLRELRPTALETLVAWLPQLSNERVRQLVQAAADRSAAQHGGEVLRLLRMPDSPALAGIIGICGRLKLQGAVPGLGEALGHADPAVRLAAVQALDAIGTPGAMTHLEKAIDDGDRGVRIAAVRAAGARGYKNALKRVEAVVQGKTLKALDLTEKMAFFEAYGSIAGPGGIAALEGILSPRGLLRRREQPETRACAAVALARIGTEDAYRVLESAADDKELIVRNAVNRALREAKR
ncbi:MAG: HEAT repeat domain-containing protein [Gemmatimonadota bacterium]|nr:HEAT repeat domain-containing protein [Gemmatimonadota bacterium]